MATSTKRHEILSFGNALHGAACFCAHCQRNKPFQVPSELADLFMAGKIVLFAGAGVSTEAPGITPDNFFETIGYITGNTDATRSFPDLMQDFCTTPAGKVGLISEIKKRFDYIFAHRSIYDDATRFHQELATFFPIDTIVTTNWDTYFEDECAATPFVEDKDISLWDVADRKVLKLHGTIANFGSIVATRQDYDQCTRRLKKGLLGAHLKSLLATRSVVFVGYSLRDDDFLQIYGAVRNHLKDFHRQAYFVTPILADSDRDRLQALNLHLIETDGQFFISELKKYAQSAQCICTDDMYSQIAAKLFEAHEAHTWLHDEFSAHKYPQILVSSWYQDGIQHSLERILRLRKTGQYSNLHRLIETGNSYEQYARKYLRDKNYADAAYCYGYAYGYRFASLVGGKSLDKSSQPPLFFYFGFLGWSKSAFRKSLSKLPTRHKAAFRYCKSIMNKYPRDAEVVLHHMAQLNLGKYIRD